MCTALTATLALAATLVAGSVVRASEMIARAGMSLSRSCPLTTWFHVAGVLVTLAVLAPPPAPGLVVDVCIRAGAVLLAEGAVLIGGVVVLAYRRHAPTPTAPPLPEDLR